jgi:hypothetical protein
VYEQASKPRELLEHKARNSELNSRQFNNRVQNFEEEGSEHQTENLYNTKKISKTLLLIILITITIIGISGQHLFPQKLTNFAEFLKLINVEAFESYKTQNIKLAEDTSQIIDNSSLNQISIKKSTPNAKYSKSLVLLDLEDWRKNWSSRKLENFITFYHPNFPDLKIFKNNKKRIFKKARFIKISLKNIVSRVEGDKIVTGFIQVYKSKNYNDSSVKELTWAKTKRGWKIIEEKNINSNVAKQEKR